MRLIKRALQTTRFQGPDRAFMLIGRHFSYKSDFHRRVGSLPYPLPLFAYRTMLAYIRGVNSTLRRLSPLKYTDADPYKTLWIHPDRIERTNCGAARRRGWVEPGKWDIKGSDFMDQTVPKAIDQRYADGLDWPETVLADAYTDSDLASEYGAKIDRLKNNIETKGYHSQKQLIQTDWEVAWGELNDSIHPVLNEIGVDIGRNGEFLWNMCGRHRLAIAKAIDLDCVCVQIYRRHTEWQRRRNKIIEGSGISSTYSDHPDLQDIL